MKYFSLPKEKQLPIVKFRLPRNALRVSLYNLLPEHKARTDDSHNHTPRSLPPQQQGKTPSHPGLTAEASVTWGLQLHEDPQRGVQDSDEPYGDTASGLQGSNGVSATEGALAAEPELNPSPGRLTGSSRKELLWGTGCPSDHPSLEQMVRDTSPDLIMKYGKMAPKKEARGKEKMWEPSVML